MTSPVYDVAVIGAGAAGWMAAIQAARRRASVLLLDGHRKPGAKILMSGGTRCNVTHETVSERDFASTHPRRVRNILAAFSAGQARQFFEEIGVRLVREPDGKYFPETNSARTVLQGLRNEAERLGVRLQHPVKVTNLVRNGETFTLRAENFECDARTVILATGGLSYPATGSDGSGYRLALSLGHTLIPTSPALTPLCIRDEIWKNLSGIALPSRLTLKEGRKKIRVCEGALLFTHFGLSGPAALNMSRFWDRERRERDVLLEASLLPGSHEDALGAELCAVAEASPNLGLKTFLRGRLPERVALAVLEHAGIPAERRLGDTGSPERLRLMHSLFHLSFDFKGVYGFDKAEVTAGGIPLDQVMDTTMESRLVPGLFLAGEMLDADGQIGGFNFQWAWATGTLAGIAAARKGTSPESAAL